MSKPWQDREAFKSLYIDEGMSESEMAVHWDSSYQTMYYWAKKHQLRESKHLKAWTDEDTLVHLYLDKEWSITDISERLGCSPSTIIYWLRKYDIETRGRGYGSHNRVERVDRFMSNEGYIRAQCNNLNGGTDSIAMHRLLAVAEYGFEAVEGMDVHHENGLKWDNRPENIELISHSEHGRVHSREKRRDSQGNFASD